MADPTPAGIAIVGMAGMFPGAPDIDTFWRNICAGVDAITDAPASRWDPLFYDPEASSADRFYCKRGGFIDDLADFDPTRFGIMPVAVEGAEPDQLLALATASAALDDAGGAHRGLAADKLGVIIGRGGYLNAGVARLDQRVRTAQQLVQTLRSLLPDIDEDRLAQVKAEFQAQLGPERPEASIGLVPNLAASRIANRLDFQGPAYTVDAACASSLLAVSQGMDQLASGRCDLVVAGGVHHCHDLTIWSVFTQLGALSPSQQIRPFSNAADGILIGEGTGLFVLKREADAERDGDRIYAVIRGAGVASDGRDASLMSPRVEGQVLALEQAWQRSGLDPATVGLIEAHGTATPAGDEAELETLRRIFGKSDDGSPTAGLGSVKSMIGHAMPAAGAAGLAKAALAVHHGILPPTLHVEDPNPHLADTRFRLIANAEPWPEGPTTRRAGVNAFGFGGINAHLVIEEHRSAGGSRRRPSPSSLEVAPPPPPAPGSDTEPMLLLAGDDAADLARQLAALGPAALDAAPPGHPQVPTGGPARLAIVAPNAKRLELAAKVLERGHAFRGRNDVWFEPEGLLGAGGKVAFMFPGVEPDFAPSVDDVAAHFQLPGVQVLEGASALEAQSLGIIALGRLLAGALEAMNIEPDLMAGHSLGEWAGQIVSQMIPAEAVDPFIDEFDAGSTEVPGVAFLALGCGVEVAAELIEGLDDVTVSHDNCPHQSVICGHVETIALAAERARGRKVFAQQMPFQSGFHSPMFRPFLAGMHEQFGHLPLQAPRVPLWSATIGAPYPDDPDAIRELAVRHLVEPVRFRDLVLKLHEAGVRVFLQAGVGSLTAFIDDTLRDHEFLAMAATSPKQTGMGQLQRVAAALWVEGAPVDFAVLASGPAAAAAAPASSPGAGQPGRLAPGDAHRRSGEPTGPAAGGRPMRLSLGAPLVAGLTPLEPSATAAGNGGGFRFAAPDDTGSPRVVAAFGAALTDATEAARQVLDQLAARPPGPSRPAPAAPSAPTSAPGAGPAPAATSTDPEPIVGPREYSLAAQPTLADHAFFAQAPDWPYPEDRFPLVPMTGIIEDLMDAACELYPGHVAVAVTDVRAFRWLAVDPPVTVTVRAAVDGGPYGPGDTKRVKVAIDGHARATVLVAPAHEPMPAPAPVPLVEPRQSPVPADLLYVDGRMFHGPTFQGVQEFTAYGDNGMVARMTTPPARGSLLDNAGQVLGFWVAITVDRDRLVLPTSIERIDFYGPHPAPGTEVGCAVHITDVTDKAVRGDLELTVDGRVWVRISGWEDRRFESDDALFLALQQPDKKLVSTITPAGYALTCERWPDSASRDVVMRRYLGAPEKPDYERRNPNAQRQWLLGRVAAKDAARRVLWDRGTGPLFPAEVEVSNDHEGRPVLQGRFSDDLRVSIAHTDGVGVALVADGIDVGIDIELVEPRTETFESMVLTDAERHLHPADDGEERDVWLTRLWAAKEAAAKAAGTGLQGRPKDWEVVSVSDNVLVVGGRRIATDRLSLPPDSPQAQDYVVAWTIIDQ